MTNREARMGEALGRERKAARLALTLMRYADPGKAVLAAQSERVRERTQLLCKYGHVSPETWERVVELLKDVP